MQYSTKYLQKYILIYFRTNDKVYKAKILSYKRQETFKIIYEELPVRTKNLLKNFRIINNTE